MGQSDSSHIGRRDLRRLRDLAVVTICISAAITAPSSEERRVEGLVVRLNQSDWTDSSRQKSLYGSVTFWWTVCVLAMLLLVGLFSFGFTVIP